MLFTTKWCLNPKYNNQGLDYQLNTLAAKNQLKKKKKMKPYWIDMQWYKKCYSFGRFLNI